MVAVISALGLVADVFMGVFLSKCKLGDYLDESHRMIDWVLHSQITAYLLLFITEKKHVLSLVANEAVKTEGKTSVNQHRWEQRVCEGGNSIYLPDKDIIITAAKLCWRKYMETWWIQQKSVTRDKLHTCWTTSFCSFSCFWYFCSWDHIFTSHCPQVQRHILSPYGRMQWRIDRFIFTWLHFLE